MIKAKRFATTRRLALALSVALVVGACGGDDDTTNSSNGASADVEQVVRASVEAENKRATDDFLKLWTDEGLESYDSGTREEISAGKSESFGSTEFEIVDQLNTKVEGSKASTQVHVAPKKFAVARILYLASFELIKDGDDWIIDGFEFTGSPPAGKDAELVEVIGLDYAFSVAKNEVPSDVAFKFENTGKEQHEMTLFRGPDGTDVSTAKAALENVDGSELKDLPDGYEADHLAFAEVGKTVDITFAEPLKNGTYFMACFIPQGGFGENGPVNPEGKPHIQLGMISPLTVK